jgi:hypothetical protein
MNCAAVPIVSGHYFPEFRRTFVTNGKEFVENIVGRSWPLATVEFETCLE